MLDYVVHPQDWNIYLGAGDLDQPIWRSQMRCTELDMDITKCLADGPDDHSCEHTMDVAVKCHPPTWGGRFLLMLLCVKKITDNYIT